MRVIEKDAGFGLLEALVSVLVLSIGLVGLALLQINSIHYNYQATLRNIAVVQANNMIARMNANPPGVTAGSYNNITTSTPASITCGNCNPSQIAQYDAYYWNTLNSILLPAGRGRVTGNGSQFIVTVFWDDNHTGATGLNCSSNHQVDLSCYSVEVQL